MFIFFSTRITDEAEKLRAAITAACLALTEAESNLNQLDSGAGDGDCGSTLARGAKGEHQLVECTEGGIQVIVSETTATFCSCYSHHAVYVCRGHCYLHDEFYVQLCGSVLSTQCTFCVMRLLIIVRTPSLFLPSFCLRSAVLKELEKDECGELVSRPSLLARRLASIADATMGGASGWV